MAGVADHVSDEVPFLDVVDPGFDFGSPEVMAARERSWYANSPVDVLVLRYAEGHALLRDQRLGQNGRRFLEMNGVFDGPIHDWFIPMIANQDGAHHQRLRGLVHEVFTPRMINGLRPFIRAKVAELTERLASTPECDFIQDFGNPLPLAVMCELLGVPPEDYDRFSVWTTDIGLVFSLAYGGDIRERVETAIVGLDGYVEFLMADKEADPGEDLISALVTARHDTRVSAEELRNLLVTLVFGAHDSTRQQLANAMVAFAGHPDQWTLLGRRPELADRATEEVMRWLPAVPTLGRFATADFDYQGLHLTEDTFVVVCATPAQRDPRAFGAGGAGFDITAAHEATTLQFGAGPHYCLGAALARAEIGEALPILAGRLGPPVVTGPFTWRPPIGIHGPETLPLRFPPVGHER